MFEPLGHRCRRSEPHCTYHMTVYPRAIPSGVWIYDPPSFFGPEVRERELLLHCCSMQATFTVWLLALEDATMEALRGSPERDASERPSTRMTTRVKESVSEKYEHTCIHTASIGILVHSALLASSGSKAAVKRNAPGTA